MFAQRVIFAAPAALPVAHLQRRAVHGLAAAAATRTQTTTAPSATISRLSSSIVAASQLAWSKGGCRTFATKKKRAEAVKRVTGAEKWRLKQKPVAGADDPLRDVSEEEVTALNVKSAMAADDEIKASAVEATLRVKTGDADLDAGTAGGDAAGDVDQQFVADASFGRKMTLEDLDAEEAAEDATEVDGVDEYDDDDDMSELRSLQDQGGKRARRRARLERRSAQTAGRAGGSSAIGGEAIMQQRDTYVRLIPGLDAQATAMPATIAYVNARAGGTFGEAAHTGAKLAADTALQLARATASGAVETSSLSQEAEELSFPLEAPLFGEDVDFVDTDPRWTPDDFGLSVEPPQALRRRNRRRKLQKLLSTLATADEEVSDYIAQLDDDGRALLAADVARVTSLANASRRDVRAARLAQVVRKWQRTPGDTGSAAVQIAVCTEKLKMMDEHFGTHRKDKQSKRSQLALVHTRRANLKYLRRTDHVQFDKIMRTFGITEKEIAWY
jgi:small subunit ribosomal protein S15